MSGTRQSRKTFLLWKNGTVTFQEWVIAKTVPQPGDMKQGSQNDKIYKRAQSAKWYCRKNGIVYKMNQALEDDSIRYTFIEKSIKSDKL